MRLAYLVSRYPAISHTFVLAEVLELRRQGFEIDTFAIRRAPPEEVLSSADREAAATTYAVLPAHPRELVRGHLRALVRDPAAYLSALLFAARLGGLDLRAILWKLFYFAEAMVVWDQCERRGLRHIHVHFPNVAADVALLATRYGGSGWGFSMTLHGPTELYDVPGHRLVEKVRAARFVICISHYMRSQLLNFVDRRDRGKLHVLRCGVDLRRFSPEPAGSQPSRRSARLLAVGRLDVRKGHALLVEALARLVRDGVEAELTIVGDGPERAHLEQLALELGVGERVRFAGAVGHDAMPGYFREADIFCMPSFAEGIPIVLMEAMATGLPVVATRIMGIPELVRDGVVGTLVTPGDVGELAAALRGQLEDPDGRSRMGAAGRERVAGEFELTECTRRVGELMLTAAASDDAAR